MKINAVSNALLQGVNEFLTFILTFLNDSGKILYRQTTCDIIQLTWVS